jgi:hypothetical protein
MAGAPIASNIVLGDPIIVLEPADEVNRAEVPIRDVLTATETH